MKAIKKHIDDALNYNDPIVNQLPPDEYKSMVAAKLQVILNQMANRLHDEINSIPLSKLPLSYGIIQDKLMALLDDAPQKPQKTITMSHTDFNKIIQELPHKEKLI